MRIDLSDKRSWRIVKDVSGLREIRGDWERLFHSNPRHTPFQSWPWLATWVKHLAGQTPLRIICGQSSQGELLFALPLVQRITGRTGGASEYFIACGYGPECSDHLGALSSPSIDDKLPAITAFALKQFVPDKSRVILTSLDDADDHAKDLYLQLLKKGRTVRLNQYQLCPVVELPETWDLFQGRLSRNFSSQIGRYQRRIDRHATVKMLSVKPSGALHFTEELIRLNKTRIADKGEVSSLSDPRFSAFLLEAVPMMAEEGLAWLDVLTDDGTIKATALHLVHADRVYYYLGGFDGNYANLRPGIALFARVIQRSIELGYTSYDFLRGTEPYKYRWGCKDVSTWRLDIYPQRVGGSLAAIKDDLARRWRATTRRLKDMRRKHSR